MKALKPYQDKIKEKYKNDENAMNRATGKLFEDAKQNPLAGCFLSLAQLPIILGLYRGVRLLAVEGKLNEPFLWLPSLEGPVSAPDYRGLDWLLTAWTANPDGSGGLPIPQLGWEATLAFLIFPVTLVFLQGLTMQVLQPPIDENATEKQKEELATSQNVMKFLPLMIGVFSIQVPAGLTIYWVATNLFTLTQTLLVRAYYRANPPQIDLPDYWGALDENADFDSMTPDERRKAVQSGIQIGPSFQDMEDEARFHCFIERQSIRLESDAWKRIQNVPQLAALVPLELQEWAATPTPQILVTSSASSAEVGQPSTVPSGTVP
jgi:YidC/Oxa1 family membrane protein insertase